MKTLFVLLFGGLVIIPFTINPGPGLQEHAETMVKNFLASKGNYMAVYFSDIDTAFSLLEEDSNFRRLGLQAKAYQDSTFLFTPADMARADYYYGRYKEVSRQRDSMRMHYKPQPVGYLLIHHFQFDGQLWTDSFIFDFALKDFIRIRQTIE